MNKWGKGSLVALSTCEPEVVQIANKVLIIRDITALEGARSNERQAQLLREGKTTLGPGQSTHNISAEFPLSRALDIAPYPIKWVSRDEFMRIQQYGLMSVEDMKMYQNFLCQWYELAGIVKGVAEAYGYKIRQGHDWDGDHDFLDQTFDDLPHLIELVR